MPLNGRSKIEETLVTATVWHHQGYKFTLHLSSIIISHPSLLLALVISPLLSSASHQWRTRDALSVTALPPQREVLCLATLKLHHRCIRISATTGVPVGGLVAPSCSLVFEQGNTSVKVTMLDPSLFIADTSRDEEIARKLFGNLNRDILRLPGDGKIIILDDSDDDGEAQEGTTAKNKSTAAPASTDDAPVEARIDNSDDQGPDQEANGSDLSGHSTGNP
jgi:hypothetical protein